MFIEVRQHVRQQHDGFYIVHCEGSFIPGPEMGYIEAKLEEIEKLECTRLLVDFQDVVSIGSIGVTFIVAAFSSVVRRPGGRFVLTGVNSRVRRVLDLTRVSRIISLAADLASGMAILAAADTAASTGGFNFLSNFVQG
jgi:anti-anti-sigma factor